MLYTRGLRFFSISICVLQMSACAPMGPPTGIVKMNDAKTFGTFRWDDGSRYEGAFKNGKIDGEGTYFYRIPNDQLYEIDQSRDPYQFDGGHITAKFANSGGYIFGPATWTVPGSNLGYGSIGFTYEGRLAQGAQGEGRVTFDDGRTFVGHFDFTPAQYSWYGKGSRELWNRSALLGSKITGFGTWTWPNGSIFTGVTFDYYLVDRSVVGMDDGFCARSLVVGKGTLRVPGEPDYVGLVGEYYNHSGIAPIDQENFDDRVDKISSCPNKVAATRARGDYLQAQYDASMEQARQNAHDMLMRDLASTPAQNAATMAEIGAASRGSSVEAEQAKARRDTAFYAAVAEQEEDPNSQYNRDKRANERRLAAERIAEKERNDASNARRKKLADAAASSAEKTRETDTLKESEKKKKEDDDLKVQQAAAEKHRIAQEQEADKAAKLEQKRRADEDAYKAKALQEKKELDKNISMQQYLIKMASSIKLYARHCPDGKGVHFVVGLRPAVKPTPVSCINVHYTANCPGNVSNASGVINNFLGAGTDCFFGDAAAISPTPMCEPKEVRLQVTKVVACTE